MAKCTGIRCPMQIGYKVDECDHKDCPYRTEPITNADRIRAMSDEELAKLIAENAYTGACNDFGIPHQGQCCHNCERCDAIIKWLKHPAE